MHFEHPARSRSLFRIVTMLAVCGILAACGYKGPLYMPGSPQDHPRPVPPPALVPGQTATPDTAAPATARPNPSGATQPLPDLFQQQ